MDAKEFTAKVIRKIYRKIFQPKFASPICEIDRSKANLQIYNLLMAESPCMISRIGTTEMGILLNYLAIQDKRNILMRLYCYITDNVGLPWWDSSNLKSMKNNSGIFPETYEILNQFAKRYLSDIPEIDILGSLNYGEKYMPLKSETIKVHLECLYPFWTEQPWTLALKGKKVLVVHPFVDTITSQYAKREFLFNNQDILPEFELKTLRAIQSSAGAKVPYKSWFEALKWMENEIAKIDFDICILGCGAYGLPLAATVKRMGKKAIHLGGGSQLLFGIKGKRWDNNAYHWKNFPQLNTNYSSLYNEYWVRPSKNETPQAALNVEGACYW